MIHIAEFFTTVTQKSYFTLYCIREQKQNKNLSQKEEQSQDEMNQERGS